MLENIAKNLQIIYLSIVIVSAGKWKPFRDNLRQSGEVSSSVMTTTTTTSPEPETTSSTLPTVSTSTEPPPEIYEDYPWRVLCKFQLNSHPCNDQSYTFTYSYDIKMQDCIKGKVTESCSDSSINTFSSLSDCTATCREFGSHQITTDLTEHPQVFCRLQPDFGYCNEYHPRWYFDVTARECRGFSWSGCGGNLNRFNSDHECLSKCLPIIKY